MPSPADTLVTKYPTRISQLKGPVHDYLKKWAPYSGTEQNLYMAVFYPDARYWSPFKQFSSDVQHDNPGIKTPADYIKKVNAAKGPLLNKDEETALREVSAKLGVTRDSLYRLISFESGWDPHARNKISGARGLIQFMPSTAKWMGFSAGIDVMALAFAALGVWWFFLRK